MSHEPFDTLAPVYAVGALDGDDLVRFEAHLREGCPTCEAVLRESEEALAALGREAPPMIPPAHVREALLRRVRRVRRARGHARFRWLPWAAGHGGGRDRGRRVHRRHGGVALRGAARR